jgi:hypothetical protein
MGRRTDFFAVYYSGLVYCDEHVNILVSLGWRDMIGFWETGSYDQGLGFLYFRSTKHGFFKRDITSWQGATTGYSGTIWKGTSLYSSPGACGWLDAECPMLTRRLDPN